MQEPEENIQFDTMPDFGGMFKGAKQDEWVDDKVYDSLYEELMEKCHPNRFIGVERFDSDQFNKANHIFAELQTMKGQPDDNLIELRNRAMDELGIHISTKKKFEYLKQYLSPEVYTNMQPYDAERVAESGKWYSLLLQQRNDIIALEQLELQAMDFISKKKSEEEILKKKESENEIIGAKEEGNEKLTEMAMIAMLGIVFLIIVVALATGILWQ